MEAEYEEGDGELDDGEEDRGGEEDREPGKVPKRGDDCIFKSCRSSLGQRAIALPINGGAFHDRFSA